ncbi:MAG: type III CRISPR-associated RAMP protein Csx7 [Candidatus Promineifilaceae bacterium]
MRGFERRYLFKGLLALKTGLHIGGGDPNLSASNRPIIRTADGQPYIPGSSFKGAFRSTVEKLAATLGVASCSLEGGTGCPGAQGVEQKVFNARRKGWDELKLIASLENGFTHDGTQIILCDTCRLFGSPYMASKILFSDLYLNDTLEGIVQTRNGVAIDRDSERIKEGLLYDYEVVSSAMTFDVQIVLEDPSDRDLQLACIGLSEFVSGLAGLGGNRSRGLGNCQLDDLCVYELDLRKETTDINERAKRLRRYLMNRKLADKMTQVSDSADWLNQQIDELCLEVM